MATSSRDIPALRNPSGILPLGGDQGQRPIADPAKTPTKFDWVSASRKQVRASAQILQARVAATGPASLDFLWHPNRLAVAPSHGQAAHRLLVRLRPRQ